MSATNEFKLTGALLLAAAMSLTACGGGSGGGSDSTRLDIPSGGIPGTEQPRSPEGEFCDDPDQLFTLDVSSIRPADGETGVATGSHISMSFSHEPDPAALTNPEFIGLEVTGGEQVDLIVQVDGRDVTFRPAEPPLLENTSYTFYVNASGVSGIEAAVCAEAGFDPKFLTLADENGDPLTDDDGNPVTEKETSFETGDGNFLAVVNSSPQDGDRVPASSEISVTFNQPVDPDTVICEGDNAVIILEKLDAEGGSERVTGTCTVVNGGTKVVFVPDDGLDSSSEYRLTVDANGVQAEEEGVGAIDEPFVIEFSTTDSILDLENCASVVGGICVLGGDDHDGGLVDVLLAPDGPLGPIADNIGGSEELAAALTILLEDDDGSLATLLENMLLEGNAQEALELLLLGDEEGNGGLADIIEQLLLGDENGEGLVGLLGEDGVAGLLEALLLDPADPDCQAPLGTVCLVGGGEGQQGLLDLLIADDGALASLGLSQQELLDALGDTLASDGSLADLVESLLLEGQLEQGLEAILLGDPNDPDSNGLLTIIDNLLDPEDGLIDGLICTIGGLLGIGC